MAESAAARTLRLWEDVEPAPSSPTALERLAPKPRKAVTTTPFLPFEESELAPPESCVRAKPEPEELTREQRRSRRKRDVRARTVSMRRMSKRELEIGRQLYPETESMPRPKTRSECFLWRIACHHCNGSGFDEEGKVESSRLDRDAVWNADGGCESSHGSKRGSKEDSLAVPMRLRESKGDSSIRAKGRTGADVWVQDRSGAQDAHRSDRQEIRHASGAEPGWNSQARKGHVPNVALPMRLREAESHPRATATAPTDQVLRVRNGEARGVYGTAQCADPGIQSMGINASKVPQSQKSELPKLRGKGDYGLQTLGESSELSGRHGPQAKPESFLGQNRRKRELRAEQLPLGNPHTASQKQEDHACHYCGGSGLEFVRLVGKDRRFEVHNQGAYQAWLESRACGNAKTNRLIPCVWSGCEHHLYLDVSLRTGAIKFNVPDLEVWEMSESCALDVADRGGATLEEVGAIMNLTRERVRQIEVGAMSQLQHKHGDVLEELFDSEPNGKGRRRLPVLREFIADGPATGRSRIRAILGPDWDECESDNDESDDDEGEDL